MRSIRSTLGSLFLFCFALAAAGCEDPAAWRTDPLLATDTVDLVAPTAPAQFAHLPTALDVTAANGVIIGGRHPERAADAGEWDFAVRVREGALVLIPAGALGLETNPAITRALNGQTFEQVTNAPPRASFLTDSAVVMQVGSVYVARSRALPFCFSTTPFQYAKLQPLVVNAEEGRLTVQLTTSERCGDTRLTMPGS